MCFRYQLLTSYTASLHNFEYKPSKTTAATFLLFCGTRIFCFPSRKIATCALLTVYSCSGRFWCLEYWWGSDLLDGKSRAREWIHKLWQYLTDIKYMSRSHYLMDSWSVEIASGLRLFETSQKDFLDLIVQYSCIPVSDRTNFREERYTNQMLDMSETEY